MGLFKKNNNEETPRRKINPTNMMLIRLLAVGYVLWILKDLVVGYVQGAEGAPSLKVLILIIVLFVVGCGWIIYMTIKQYKQLTAEQAAEAEALAALEAAEEEEDWEEEIQEEAEE